MNRSDDSRGPWLSRPCSIVFTRDPSQPISKTTENSKLDAGGDEVEEVLVARRGARVARDLLHFVLSNSFPVRFGLWMVPTTRTVRVIIEHSRLSSPDTVSPPLQKFNATFNGIGRRARRKARAARRRCAPCLFRWDYSVEISSRCRVDSRFVREDSNPRSRECFRRFSTSLESRLSRHRDTSRRPSLKNSNLERRYIYILQPVGKDAEARTDGFRVLDGEPAHVEGEFGGEGLKFAQRLADGHALVAHVEEDGKDSLPFPSL